MTEIRVLVGTTDYVGATAFYRDLLAFPVNEEWRDPDGRRGTLFQASAGGVIEVIEDSPEFPAEPPRGVSVAIEVPDADGLHQRLRQAGVPITVPLADQPWGHRNFEIHDPSGLPLVFFTVLGAEAAHA